MSKAIAGPTSELLRTATARHEALTRRSIAQLATRAHYKSPSSTFRAIYESVLFRDSDASRGHQPRRSAADRHAPAQPPHSLVSRQDLDVASQHRASFRFHPRVEVQLQTDSSPAEHRIYRSAHRGRRLLLLHALDLADHYSQLANYMRLNNLIPPTALPRPRP